MPPAKTTSPAAILLDIVLRPWRTLQGRAPGECGTSSLENESWRKPILRQDSLANRLLTKMHGRIRIHGDGYGCELTNAQ